MPKRSKSASSFISILLDFVEITFIGIAVLVLVYLFVGQPLEITGDSMYPTLHNKEKIISEKISGKISAIERGDILVFRHPERPDQYLIKRVVGLPNEKFEIKDGHILINDEKLPEPYLEEENTYGGEKIHTSINIIVPENEYVLLGDNRLNSTDSRKWGTIKEENIVGKAFVVFAPLNRMRIIGTKVDVENTVNMIKSSTQK